jgi:hypothetical protein
MQGKEKEKGDISVYFKFKYNQNLIRSVNDVNLFTHKITIFELIRSLKNSQVEIVIEESN